MSRKNTVPAFLFYLCGFMALANNIQIFLKKKLEKNKLERKDFAEKSGISLTAVNQLINAQRPNPDISTILKIAKYFKCTVDEVLRRKKDYYKNLQNYNDISLDEIYSTLRDFINNKLKEEDIKPKELSLKIGFSESPIVEFINNSTKRLSTAVIVALANYFKVSVDKMIGRVSPANQKPLQTTEPNLTSKNQ